jgi:mono/diheme cytochrome c family protein
MRIVIALLALSVLAGGCRQGMVDQARVGPLAENDFFQDGSGSRPIPAHTVAQGRLNEDERFFTGIENDRLITAFPLPVTRQLLARGRERFDIYCAVCHGRTGAGDGMIVQRGFPRPPSLHEARLRDAPVGHFFDVITSGYGVMYSYAGRVGPEDRWAIAAYIRALQFSRRATPDDLPPEERAKLEAMQKP